VCVCVCAVCVWCVCVWCSHKQCLREDRQYFQITFLSLIYIDRTKKNLNPTLEFYGENDARKPRSSCCSTYCACLGRRAVSNITDNHQDSSLCHKYSKSKHYVLATTVLSAQVRP